MALRIAKSLEAFHAVGWVHKSIRSDCILFMVKDEKHREDAYASPLLTGFEFSRVASGPTDYTHDDKIERNLYRHPERQGPPQVAFTKIHDIYALGVVLLEIGLWKSVISLYQRKADELMKLGHGREFDTAERKKWLISRAEKYLPHNMGLKYKTVVVSCLSSDFGSDVETAKFAMDFHEKVVESLQSIKVG
jgi:serine/threonine protein kinase